MRIYILHSWLSLALLSLPAVVQAQYLVATNNGAVTIIGYTGSGGALIIPETIYGLPVTSIGNDAFLYCTTLTSVTMGTNVTSIGNGAFWYCTNLTSITIGTNVTSIGDMAFFFCKSLKSVTIPSGVTDILSETFKWCTSLTNVVIPNSVTRIGGWQAFWGCISLTKVTIPNRVTFIGDQTFRACTSLKGVYFNGSAPAAYSTTFQGDPATAYYLPGTSGWGAFSAKTGLPVALWTPQVQTSDASFGVRTNQFGFKINWASGMTVVVEASTNLANQSWSPLGTNRLTGDWCYFTDPQWTNYPARLYRLRSP